MVAPTFFTETAPDADLRFAAPGQQNPFGTVGENAGIPNLGMLTMATSFYLFRKE
jgi:hypothetical protein